MLLLEERRPFILSVVRIRCVLECKELIEKVNKFNKLFSLNIPDMFYDKDGRMEAHLAPFILREICDCLLEERKFNYKNVTLFENRDDLDYDFITDTVISQLDNNFIEFCNIDLDNDITDSILNKIRYAVTDIIVNAIKDEVCENEN